ncbi:hypothetical protein HYH03_008839 [Edaphochlamys debaryana]|uniref:Uncharacterized protein n=1 Tax=Edaphochlamys debaryana TaxID=47281 RepID=A0A835XZL2_9CHLO|nr:hypothetical protein HYH03_008839 [Edaphochlamys debaryana]|eukprot:KAG2492930.1 hypothetical protein HYH03_008839 [Edaphochlamys debaryana]
MYFGSALQALPGITVTTTVMDMDAFAAGGSNSIDVFLIDSYFESYKATHASAVKAWLRLSKKGLLVTGHAWSWGFSHENANLYTDLAINKVLWPLGFSLSVRYTYGFLDAPAWVPDSWPYYNAFFAVTRMKEQLATGITLPEDARTPAWSALSSFMATLPPRTDTASYVELASVYVALTPLRGVTALAGFDFAQLVTLDWTKLNPPPADVQAYVTNLLQLLSNVTGPYARHPFASTLAIFAPKGFPVVLSKDEGAGSAVVAAMEPPGGGRVVAFGHEGMIAGCCSAGDSYDKLTVNAFRWVSNRTKTVRIAGTADYMAAPLANIRTALRALAGGPINVTTTATTLDQFTAGASANVDVLWVDTYAEYTAVHVSAILTWLKARPNRGIIVSGQAWSWSYSHPHANVFTDLPANALLWPLGLAVSTFAPWGAQDAPTSPPSAWLWHNAAYSLPRIRAAKENASTPLPGKWVYAAANAGIKLLTAVLPVRGTPGIAAAVAAMDTARATTGPVAGPNSPLDLSSTPPAELLNVAMDAWAVRTRDLTTLNPNGGSRSAAAYPGLPRSGAAARTTTLTFSTRNLVTPPNSQMPDVDTPTWRSTGLYAQPGRLVWISVATPAVLGKGLRVRPDWRPHR